MCQNATYQIILCFHQGSSKLIPVSSHRFPSLQTLQFLAGVTPNFIQKSLTWISWLVRARLVSDASQYASILKSIGDPFFDRSSSESAFQISMEGLSKDASGTEKHKKIVWTLLGDQGHGPNVAVTGDRNYNFD